MPASSGTNIDIAIKVQGGAEATKAAQQVGEAYNQMGENIQQSSKKVESGFASIDRASKGPLANTNKSIDTTVKQTGVLSSTGGKNVTDFGNSFTRGLSGAPRTLQPLTDSIDKTNKSTTSLTQTGRQLGTSMTSLVGSFSAVGGSAIALFEAYDSVGDAQLNVEKVSVRLQNQQRILANLQNDLTEATAKYGAGSTQVAEIQARLEVQNQKVAVGMGDLENAQENLAITQTHFGREVIPITIAALGSLMTVFAQGKETFATFKSGLSSLTTALSSTDKVMKLISLTNPFFLALTVGGAIVGAFVTNLFGFRDAVMSVGKAIGDAIPFLSPFLTMLGDFGKLISGGMDEGANKASEFSDEFGKSMNEAGEAMNAFGETVDQEASAASQRLQSFIDAMKKRSQELRKEIETAGKPVGPKPSGELQGATFAERGLNQPLKTKIFDPVLDAEGKAFGKTILDVMKNVQLLTDINGKAVVAEDQLAAAFKSAGLTGAQQNQIYSALDAAGISYKQTLSELAGVKEGEKQSIDASVASAEKELATNEARIKAFQEYQVMLGQVQGPLEQLTTEHNNLFAVLAQTQGVQALANQGWKQFENAALKAGQAVIIQKGYLDAYSEGLKNPIYQTTLFAKGMYDQRQAFLDTQAGIISMQGKLKEMQTEYASGEASVVAYNDALYKQKIAIEESKIELDGMRGTYDAIAQSMAEGEAQSIAFTQGYEQQRAAIQNTTLELDKQAGALKATGEALRDGTLLANAGKEAQNEYYQSLVDSITEIEKLSVTLDEYNKNLDKGIPQALAYAKANLEAKLATAQLSEEFAKLRGEGDQLLANLRDVGAMTNLTNNAFQKGLNDATKWATSIQEANAQALGMRQRLSEIGAGFGGIPVPIYASTKAMQEWVEVSLGLPDAVDKGVKSAVDKAKGAIDELTKAWQKGSNLSGKEIEKVLGLNLPKEIDKEINMHFKFKANENEMREGMTNLVGLMGEMGASLSDKSAQTIADSMQRGLDQRLNNGTISASFHKYFSDMLATMPKPSDTAAFAEWIAHFDQLNTAIESGNPEMINAVMDAMISKSTEVEKSAMAIKGYAEAINQTQKAIDEYNKNAPGLYDNTTPTNIFTQLSAEQNKGNKKYGNKDQPQPPGGQTVDTSAIDQASEKLNAFNLALAAIPTTIAKVVTEGNTALLPLGDPFTVEIPQKILDFSTALEAMPAWIGEQAAAINESFLTIGDPFIKEIPQKILEFSNALAEMPGFVATSVVSPIIQNFIGMANALRSGPFATIQRDAAVAFQAVTNIANAEAGKLRTAFDSAVAAVITQFGALQNAATQVFSAIIQAASNAQDAVRNLAGEINGLQDKTVTITTRHVDVYETQQAATGFGPMIVDHPMHLLVGEAGPEFVNVTPLNTTGGKNLPPERRFELYNDPGKKRFDTPPPMMLANGTNGMPGLDGFNASGTSQTNSGSIPAVSSTTYDMRLLFVGLNKLITDAIPVEIVRSAVSLGGVGSGSSGTSSSSQTNTGTNSQSSMIVSPGSIINQGNNVNISNDSNSNNNTAPGGQIIQGPGSSGNLDNNGGMGNNTGSNSAGLNITGSNGNYNYQSQNGNVNTGSNSTGSTSGLGTNTSAQGVMNNGGMVVDGKSGKVIMNGMIVDGKNGTVIMTGNGQSGGGGGLGGIINGPGANSPIYPINARTGSATEPLRGPFRSGQDNQFGIYDTGRPNPYQDMGVYSGGGTNGTIGLPGLPGGLGSIFDFINKLLGQIFGGLKLNQSFNLQIDSDFIGRSMFNNVTSTLATLQR